MSNNYPGMNLGYFPDASIFHIRGKELEFPYSPSERKGLKHMPNADISRRVWREDLINKLSS